MFANALERAVLSSIETKAAEWEGHPHYEEDPTDDDDEDREPTSEPEVAWEDHLYYSSADDDQDLAWEESYNYY